MAVSIHALQLKKAFNAVKKIAPDIFILDGRNEMLTLYASSAVLHIAISLLPVAESFFGAFYFKSFSAFVDTLPDEEITITIRETRCIVTGKRTRATFGTVENYMLYKPDTSRYVAAFSLTGKELASIAKDTTFAAEKQNMGRDLFRCVYVEPGNNCLYFVATNTYKLAERVVHMSHGLDTSLLLFAPGLNAIASIFAVSEEVLCSIAPDYCNCIFADDVITCYLATHEGLFPQYRNFFPQKSTTYCVFLTNELLQAIRRTQTYDAEWVKFSLEGTVCTVDAVEQELGDVETTFEVEEQAVQAYFSLPTQRILNILEHIQTETCTMSCDVQPDSRRTAISFCSSDGRVKYCITPRKE